MDWDVKLNGVSIKASVASFRIEESMLNYAAQLTLNIADMTPFIGWEWHVIPAAPVCEVLLDTGSGFVSLGDYYIEKPQYDVEADSTIIQSVWGRSATAALTSPFASKLNMSWNTDTMMTDIVEDILAEVGLSWDDSQNLGSDFLIYANTFVVSDEYPADALTRLATLVGTNLVGRRDGLLYLIPTDYSPEEADVAETYDNTEIKADNLEVNLPDFGNRIKLIATDSSSSFSLQFMTDSFCVPNDSSYEKTIRVQVLDAEGDPIDNTTVDFSVDDSSLVTINDPSVQTETVLNYSEIVNAENYNTLNLSYQPDEIIGIYPIATPTANMYSLVSEIDGTEVTLSSNLDYCDSRCRVVYNIKGVATTTISGVDSATGSTELTASVGGSAISEDVYVNNSCQCPISLQMEAVPSSLENGEAGKVLLVAERDGIATEGETVNFSVVEGSGYAVIDYSSRVLRSISITEEIQSVTQLVANRKDLETKYKIDPTETITVYRFTRDEDNNVQEYGSDLFSSIIDEKRIALTDSTIENGTELSINYTCLGGAVITVTAVESLPSESGSVRIKGYMQDQSETPEEAFVTISVSDPDYDSTTENDITEESFSTSGAETSEVLSQGSAAWCARKLTNMYGETVEWDSLMEIFDSIFIIVNDGYNARAVLRSDARMAEVATTSLPGLPGHPLQCGDTSQYDILPIYFRKFPETVGTEQYWLPAASYLYDEE